MNNGNANILPAGVRCSYADGRIRVRVPGLWPSTQALRQRVACWLGTIDAAAAPARLTSFDCIIADGGDAGTPPPIAAWAQGCHDLLQRDIGLWANGCGSLHLDVTVRVKLATQERVDFAASGALAATVDAARVCPGYERTLSRVAEGWAEAASLMLAAGRPWLVSTGVQAIGLHLTVGPPAGGSVGPC